MRKQNIIRFLGYFSRAFAVGTGVWHLILFMYLLLGASQHGWVAGINYNNWGEAHIEVLLYVVFVTPVTIVGSILLLRDIRRRKPKGKAEAF